MFRTLRTRFFGGWSIDKILTKVKQQFGLRIHVYQQNCVLVLVELSNVCQLGDWVVTLAVCYYKLMQFYLDDIREKNYSKVFFKSLRSIRLYIMLVTQLLIFIEALSLQSIGFFFFVIMTKMLVRFGLCRLVLIQRETLYVLLGTVHLRNYFQRFIFLSTSLKGLSS